MTPDYSAFTFNTSGFDQDVLIALLSEWPFESFHESGESLIAYIRRNDITEVLIEYINSQQGIWYNEYTVKEIEHQNWNVVWESSFHPVSIDDYCYIRASFHASPIEKYRHEVVIAPKMAFGTGHHATTFMMLQAMAGLDFKNKKVLDFGCGTGILSVVAAKEGASQVFGVDIQPEAVENSQEHAVLNKVSDQCQFFEGGLEIAPIQQYDIILANINIPVIVGHIEPLKQMTADGGYLLLSGIMVQDESNLRENISFAPLKLESKKQNEDWLQFTYRK